MIFAFLGLGIPELIVLLLGGLCFAGVAAGIVVVSVAMARPRRHASDPDREAALEAENRRLREELARWKSENRRENP